ncbi:hypothetical protein MSSAC_2394 [Methanosarcina siciliae C2J]|uniref:Uncharacterized protein n=1 Tax=Methanosarcina siciliae C2J TaxID=1434118 RepID=A0A0E3PQV2_9EURY|nr:hypothetical protein [Methanosarcina siciliae]AKB36984.1 hypothetical protein MSSAC_2394 [Methanosarcina siciliae C2J]
MNQFKKVLMVCLILSSFSLSMGCIISPVENASAQDEVNRFVQLDTYKFEVDNYRTFEIFVMHDNKENLTFFCTYGCGGEMFSVVPDWMLNNTSYYA